jgi:hypothetical protein
MTARFGASEKAHVFAVINFENLSEEMAQGKGEHLASLASLMRIPEAQHGAFFALTQERYSTFLQEGETSSVGPGEGLERGDRREPRPRTGRRSLTSFRQGSGHRPGPCSFFSRCADSVVPVGRSSLGGACHRG